MYTYYTTKMLICFETKRSPGKKTEDLIDLVNQEKKKSTEMLIRFFVASVRFRLRSQQKQYFLDNSLPPYLLILFIRSLKKVLCSLLFDLINMISAIFIRLHLFYRPGPHPINNSLKRFG